MEKKYFLLETRESSRFVRTAQVVFGILCIIIAFYWIIFQYGSIKNDSTLWITIVFLAGFGSYQIAAGFGRITRYLEIGSDEVILKQNSVLPRVVLKASAIKKIDFYPMSIRFIMEHKKRTILRFGLSYTDLIEPVKNAIAEFAAINHIITEEMSEEI
ncbi:MAG TPA: hypothetical protein PLV06_01125 [Bacteroidales bacterium]|nr:hypothetical protein [Bacteroidales bacterium]HPJ59647.1 hypothetical protein [Bacteroidales bacterium]HPR10960.1 hypothetical protein [Bacteroidales bacterium]HRW85831.1 hypothetical protein [Bacteroidales bacterium]